MNMSHDELLTRLNVLVEAIYTLDAAGCCLHVALDDGNWQREHVQWCRENAKHGVCREVAELLLLLLLALPCFAQAHYRTQDGVLLNDPSVTPGAVRTEDVSLVCIQRTAEVRHVTRQQRHDIFLAYQVRPTPHVYELDHLIPLELGGSNESANLWPQPYAAPGAHEKDKLEDFLHREVCAGRLSLTGAQKLIASNWWEAYRWMTMGAK